MVADTLGYDLKSCETIAQIIHAKTGGNPFFVNSVFRSLYRDRIISFQDSWKWDIAKVKEIAISENVIEHTRSNISLLNPEKRDLLKLAACVGNLFLITIFSRIVGKAANELEEVLSELANEGFFILGGGEARFAHDKIREASYTFISEEEKSKNHYKIDMTYFGFM